MGVGSHTLPKKVCSIVLSRIISCYSECVPPLVVYVGECAVRLWEDPHNAKNLCSIVLSRTKLEGDLAIQNVFQKIMISDLDVLGRSMKVWVLCYFQTTPIATQCDG